MLIVLAAAFTLALAAPGVVAFARHRAPALLALAVAALFAWFARLVPSITSGAVVTASLEWLPALGVRLAFRLDGLSLLFALLITGCGALVTLYAGSYLARHPHRGRFFGILQFFMAAMLGLVLADDVVTLFVCWELTSLASYLLIGFDHGKAEARRAALRALLVTGGGGLALLAGLLMLSAAVGGTLDVAAMTMRGDEVRAHRSFVSILVLVAAGAFTKSAQVPFHFWLPPAMAAPTPVSAYLHSATMVKAGIYLLARFYPVFGGTTAWTLTLVTVGGVTMLVGSLLALRHTDLKLVLAYSTIASLGLLTLLLGVGPPGGVTAAMVFLLVHALYKAALFLVAGALDRSAGSRDVLRLGGLGRAMPITAFAAVLAGLSMAGVPPLFGFIGKEAAYGATVASETARFVLPALTVVANVLTVVAAGLVAVHPFVGTRRPEHHAVAEPPATMWIAPLVLGICGLVLGAAPGLATTVVAPAASAVAGTEIPVTLLLWHGWTVVLAMSAVTVAAGIALYRRATPLRALLARADGAIARGPGAWCEAGAHVVLRAARWQTGMFTRGGVVAALRTIVLATALLLWATLGPTLAAGIPWDTLFDAGLHEWLIVGGVVTGTVIAVGSDSRMAAVLALGLSGFLIALIYMMLGAPDLAMTQFLVETLVVVIIVLVMPHLPRDVLAPRPGARATRVRDGAMALALGAAVVTLLLMMRAAPGEWTVADDFVRGSVGLAHGRNIVNAILVDFRALDTLGEITVLLVAAIGGRALLASRDRVPPGPRPRPPTLILRTATRFLTPLLLLLSFFLLWRGHDEPGGGFVAGLVASGALALTAIAFGSRVVRRILVVSPLTLATAALGVAVLSGALALARGEPLLTSRWTNLAYGLPAVGTPLLFDLGVYLLVIGFTMQLVVTLEER